MSLTRDTGPSEVVRVRIPKSWCEELWKRTGPMVLFSDVVRAAIAQYIGRPHPLNED